MGGSQFVCLSVSEEGS